MTIKKCKTIFLAVIMLFIGAFSLFLTPFMVTADTTTAYSDVMTDLEKDPTFDLQNYPSKAEDYALELIQIAESTTGELLIYVYQPSNGTLEEDLRASYINLATDEDGLDYYRYSLTHLDSTSTFSKYKVDGFTVGTDTYRYYTISTIYRPWISGVDEAPPVGTTIEAMDYTVGWTWRVYYYNNALTYERKQREVIEIETKFVGSIRYYGGFKLYSTSCDSHFVAFSTNREIDRLIDADVVFSSQAYSSVFAVGAGTVTTPQGEPLLNQKVSLSEKEEVVYKPSGWFSPKDYDWKRIESASEFAKNEELTMDETEFVNSYQWVLRFLETEYYLSPVANNEARWTEVLDLSILRLHFITDGRVYNLGVVDNMMSGDHIPDNDVGLTYINELKAEMKELWDKILQLLFGLAIFFIIWSFLPSIITNFLTALLRAVWKGIKEIFKIVFKILFLPFRLLFGGKSRKRVKK